MFIVNNNNNNNNKRFKEKYKERITKYIFVLRKY